MNHDRIQNQNHPYGASHYSLYLSSLVEIDRH